MLILLPVLIVAVVAIGMIVAVVGLDARQLRNDPRGELQRGRRAARRRALDAATVDAAIDDPELEARAIEQAARALVREYQQARHAEDESRMRALAAEKQGDRWVARLDLLRRPGYRRVLERIDRLDATLVGLENRVDRVRATVFIDGRLTYSWHRGDGPPGPGTLEPVVIVEVRRSGLVGVQRDHASEDLLAYWTLERRDGRWIVLAAMDEDEGRHLLEGAVVAVPWADERLADETRRELAAAEGGSAGRPLPAPAGVVRGDRAVAMLRDLSLADARADPAVIEQTARAALEAWAEAVAGDESTLRQIAVGSVVDGLLARNDALGTERAIRPIAVEAVELVAAEPAISPPWVLVAVLLRAFWYRRMIGSDFPERILPEEDRVDAIEDPGDPYRPVRLLARLTFTLDGGARWPWRLVQAEVRPRER